MTTPPPTPPANLLRYPGLIPSEETVLRRWLEKHQGEYTRFEFNVRVGPGMDIPEGTPANIAKMARDNSQSRVDVIAHAGSAVTLIEVKERAKLSAAGQILGYQHLWLEDNQGVAAPAMLIVCSSFVPGADSLYKRLGIALELV